ncbi:MAG: efflux transporter outer membrane subunit [Phycisphaerales bacterium]|nr:efflux transporter outer membrane subunit [Phycisphaerales bacterium]
MKHARLGISTGVAAIVLAAGGCKVGPDYERPDAPVNDAWLTQSTTPTPADAASQRWWESFNDPTLTALVQKAYAQNLSVKSAGLRVIEARARRGIAVGRFFAQSQEVFGGVANRQLSYNAAGTGTETAFSDAQIGLQAAWELDFWGKFRRGIEAADAELLATVADYDAIVVSLVSDVATNYILVRSLEERLVFARANAALQAETLTLTQTRQKAGAVSELDVSTARATLANTQALVPQLENDLQQTKLALCVLLGETPSQLDGELTPANGAARQLPEVPAEIAAGIPAELLRRRPDVRVAERLAAAQSARIGQATADLYPSIAIAGSTGFASSTFEGVRRPNLGNIFDGESFAGFIGLQVNWPILNYGRVENNIRVQDAVYEQAVAAYRGTVLKAASDVEAGLSDFLRSKERSGFLTEGVDASKRSAELSLIQYRAGAVDFIRVNNAQTALVQQQDSLVVARAAIALGAVRTYRALGGGWEIRDGHEFVDESTVKQMRARTDWGNVLNPDWEHGKDLGFKRPDGNAVSGDEK